MSTIVGNSHWNPVGLAVLAVLVVGGAQETKSIEGVWTPVKAELGGTAVPDSVLKTIRLTLAAGKYEAVVAGEPDRGTYSLDSTTKPKRITVTGTEGPNRDKTFPAIYALDGDSLRICYDLSGAKPPTEFKTVSGTRLYLVSYVRKKD